jgi:hypothetical protein
VQAIYQDVLNRQADPVGSQLATGSLSGNDTVAARTNLASVVVNSQEGDIATINHLYAQFLHRAPDSAGLSAFLKEFQGNQNPNNSTSGSGNPSGNVTNGSGTQEDPAQEGIIPAGNRSNGNTGSGSNSGQTSGITLEQAMVTILSSPEYFSIADR